MDRPSRLLYTLQILLAGVLLMAIVFLVWFLLTPAKTSSAQARGADSSKSALTVDMTGSPNVIADGMAAAVHELGQAVDATAFAINTGAQSFASTATHAGKTVARGAQSGFAATVRGVGVGLSAVGRTVGAGVGFVGNAVGEGVGFVLRIPGNVIGSISNSSALSSVIRPSDHEEVPIIDPNSPELQAALAALPPTKDARPKPSKEDPGPAWPMHGQITTHFGVDHWPFQHTHSGIDISDGQAPGITPIKPFRPGRVVDTIHSYYGLGNHVVVDHGSGVTSVYAHLASITVQVGQKVGMGTVLGYEGSTGASTGTHLHFEIRVNGQAADPRQFISGHP